MDQPIRHVNVSPAQARRYREMTPQERIRFGADLTDTARYFARRGGTRHWSPSR